jgi:hypothetical protein
MGGVPPLNVHIELTDHLRCPREHAEAFLVLLPDRMDARRVVAGHLGCPVCGWSTAWSDGVPDFGNGWRSTNTPPFDAAAVHAMLGVDGPGGWIALAGSAGSLVEDLAVLMPGVWLVAINPAATIMPSSTTSVLIGSAWPLKAHSMRGVVLGADAIEWRDAAVRSTLPGLRTIGCGEVPTDVQLLAEAEGVWVGTHK